jgi:isocitrate dehydrogenase (NAD+)
MQYGDILSELCAGLIGGLGVAPASTSGTVAPEAIQGSAPRHTRRDRANSIALILSGTMLPWHLGRRDELEASAILLEERRG